MTGEASGERFVLRVGYDQDELLGARWWHEGMRAAIVASASGGGGDFDEGRRNALRSLAVLGTFAVFGGLLLSRCDDSSPQVAIQPSLDLQRREGAYRGATGDHLQFVDPTTFDAEGSVPTKDELDHLAEDLKPDSAQLEPFYVPTLFQSLGAPGNDALRADFRPVHSAAMDRAFGQGRAVRELLEHAERPGAVALVVDLPGPEAVAFAAGLRPFVHTVFTFDNWPHPRGVVPAHQTLGAAVWHRSAFHPATGTGPRPAAFVLDRQRLSPYHDEPDRFDNRYLAKLPEVAALRVRGIERIFYVVPEDAPAQELDDLNATFVAWRAAGITIHLLSLRDLLPGEPLPAQGAAPPSPARTSPTPPYYWHGSPATHWWFWNHYGWPGRAYPLVPVAPTRGTFGTGYLPRVRPPDFGSFEPPGRTRTVTPGGTSWFGGSGRSGSTGRTWSGGSS